MTEILGIPRYISMEALNGENGFADDIGTMSIDEIREACKHYYKPGPIKRVKNWLKYR